MISFPFRAVLAAATVILGTAPAQAHDSPSHGSAAHQHRFEVPVTKSFQESQMTWNESLGAMIMRWDVLVLNGTVVVCGAITNDNGRMRRHNKAVLNKLWVKVDGQKRLRNLSYFTVYPVGQDLIGVASNCKPLPGPVKSNSSIEMGADTIRVRD